MLQLRQALQFILLLGLMARLQPAGGSSRAALFWSHGKADRKVYGGTCKLLVTAKGYPCMDYHAKTKDGYILSMQRVPHGRVQPKDGESRQPVLLQHGVLVDGMLWFTNAPDQSLGFILADSGFDVWVANTRGTKWSRRHASLDPSRPEFWDWSWDELVDYELPAIIDAVISETGQKVHFVGHSMGTLIALASFSQGKLVDKIRSAALLCPIAYLGGITTVIARIAAISFLGEFERWLGVAEFDLNSNAALSLLEKVCKTPGMDCSDLLDAYTGRNCCFNRSTAGIALNYEPDSTSTKTMIHLCQSIRNGGVKKFDYESREANVEHYGQSEPPVYDMSSIPSSFPLFLSYGGNDALSDPNDVARLLHDLDSHDKDMLTVKYVEDYAHGDFMIATNAREQVYDDVIKFLQRH